jgi:hypothetical protein
MNESRLRLRRPRRAPTGSEAAPVSDQAHGAQSIQSPGGSEQRRLALAGAVLALLSAIVGGVIAAGASIWVANTTAQAQQRVATMTAQAQQKQSVDEYRRNNREKIYQDMFGQMTAMDSAIDSFTLMSLGVIRVLPGTTKEEQDRIFSDAQKQWQPAYDRLNAAVSNAELVSSRQVIGIAKALRQAYFVAFYNRVYSGILDKLGGAATPATGQMQGPPEFPTELNGKSIRELKAMLIVAAKEDLDLND